MTCHVICLKVPLNLMGYLVFFPFLSLFFLYILVPAIKAHGEHVYTSSQVKMVTLVKGNPKAPFQ